MQTKREKPLVFLSYSRTDSAEAAQLREDIMQANINVWWDQDILPGQDWKYEIREAIKRCNAVVLCLSAKATARKKSGIYPEALDAIAEYREYQLGEIFLIPVRFSKCSIPSIEIDGTRTLDRLQHVDLFPPKQRQEKIEKLITSIKYTLPWGKSYDEIVVLQKQDEEPQEVSNPAEQLIEITLNRDFYTYSESDQKQFLFAICEFLKMKEADIRIRGKQRGSVKLTLSLPPEKAETLLTAIKSGVFEVYGATDAELKKPQPSAEDQDALPSATADSDQPITINLEYAVSHDDRGITALGVLDTISVILGIIIVLQNFSRSQAAPEKLNLLKSALDAMEPLYNILTIITRTHDDFQSFQRFSKDKLKELKSLGDLTQTRIREILSQLHQSFRSITARSENLSFSEWSGDSARIQNVSFFSNEVEQDLIVLNDAFPELASALSSFEDAVSRIQRLYDDNDYGRELREAVIVLDSTLERILDSANSMMMSVVPVLHFMHTFIKNNI